MLAGLALPLAVAYLATPVAVRVAARFEFYDHPRGYRGHATPTPYLGGAAVVTAFILAAFVVTKQMDRTLPLVGGVLVLCAVGTVDDRRELSPWLRLAVEAGLALGLWAVGLGWSLGLGGAVDAAVTVFWIAAVVNAFNLFDNMDGAASTMAAVAAGGVAILGIVTGDPWVTAAAAALCGACLGFLPHNLCTPAKVFLGDGGSMPIGFAIAALIMIGAQDAASEWQALAMGLLFVGVPALDTTLVLVSRRRRGISVLTGGQDHLTHRTRQRVRTARSVAATLGAAQALLASLAVTTSRGGSGALLAAVVLYLVGVCVLIVLLDSKREESAGSRALSPRSADGGRRLGRISATACLVTAMGLAFGGSAFFSGYYASTIWAPAGLGLVTLFVAVAMARRPRIGGPAALTAAGLTALALWALLSGTWAPSVEDAFVYANRLLVFAALLGLLVMLVRSTRLAVWAIAGVAVGTLAVGVWVLGAMLFGDAADLFVGGRLNDPLGYINGMGAACLIGIFPCLALAERRGRWLPAAAGAGGATLLAGVGILTQSRGAFFAGLVALAAVMLIPGRSRRLAVVAVCAGALAPAAPFLAKVYTSGENGPVAAAASRHAVLALVLATVGAAAVWGLVTKRIGRRPKSHRGRGPIAWKRPTVAAAAIVAAVVGIASAGNVVTSVRGRLDSLRTPTSAVDPRLEASSRLGSLQNNRSQYWRIALRTYDAHKLKGIGAGGYSVPYFRERTTTEDVRQPHSLGFQTLAELGVVGLACLLVFLSGLVWGFLRSLRRVREAPGEGAVLVAATGMVTAWLVHTSVDWIHLLPGVTGGALVGAAALVRLQPATSVAVAPARIGRRPVTTMFRLAYTVPIALVLTLGAVSLSRQSLAEHFRALAREEVASDPRNATSLADRSLRLDPYSVDALYIKAGALRRQGNLSGARAVAAQAVRREPENFVAWAFVGDLAGRARDAPAAQRAYRRALQLNPLDPTLPSLLQFPLAGG